MTTDAKDYYISGLRNQHGVENQAIKTIKAELPRMEKYPNLHARMQQEIERSQTQATRLETLLSKHGTSYSGVKETVTGAVGAVAGVAHLPAEDEVIKNVLAAIGYKAYEIASYKALIAMAEMAGAQDDVAVLKQCQTEDMEMGDWLGENLPNLVQQHLGMQKAA